MKKVLLGQGQIPNILTTMVMKYLWYLCLIDTRNRTLHYIFQKTKKFLSIIFLHDIVSKICFVWHFFQKRQKFKKRTGRFLRFLTTPLPLLTCTCSKSTIEALWNMFKVNNENRTTSMASSVVFAVNWEHISHLF